jgi:hypothetical protein
MRDNEVLRRKRDLEFQTRVLAAVEKPKKSRLIAIVNSSLFIWFLSAILVTFGGAYLAGAQRCYGEAEDVRHVYFRTLDEIGFRRQFIAKTVDAATSIGQLRTALAKPPYLYIELRDRTLADLVQQLDRVTDRMRVSPVLVAEERKPISKYRFPISELVAGHGISRGDIPSSDDDLDLVKKFTKESYDIFSIQYPHASLVRFSALCSPYELVRDILFGILARPVVQLEPGRPIPGGNVRRYLFPGYEISQ